ncbi:MAG: sugar phosphate nucleotidyltransferase [Arenicellaceae bacterium]|nr:sugar phosphate nucleotidyltransferase [Arenicellaceae bacterium]
MPKQSIQAPLIGLIPAAGVGSRARPYTHKTHKGLFNINGRTNLERIVSLMRDDLGIEKIIVIVGYLGDSIREHLGDGSKYQVKIEYIENTKLERGWAWSVLLAREHIDTHFCVMLCDEYYTSSNHVELKNFPFSAYLSVCTGIRVDDVTLIKQNYAIEHNAGVVTNLIEKPKTVTNDIMGSGTFLFSPKIFDMLDAKFKANNYASFNLINELNNSIRSGASVSFFELLGNYVNINDPDSLQLAKYRDRIAHFSEYKISLLICPVGNEHDIQFTTKRYRELRIFDQISIVLPSDHQLKQEVSASNIDTIICPPRYKYFGQRVKYGLSELKGDIFITTEADYSFANRDVEKLLGYLKEADIVVGTRTTRQLIHKGSRMHGAARLAHSGLGKLIQVLWWTRGGRFTDVGCTFRAIWATSYREMESHLLSTGPEFLAEMVMQGLHHRQRIIEIPVNYFNRSKSLNLRHRNVATFIRILLFIVRKRIKLLFSS